MNVLYQGVSYRLPLTVVEANGPMLLGRNWSGEIKLNWHNIFAMTLSPAMGKLLEKYSELFKDDLGCARDVELNIPVDPAVKPIFYKPRTVPLAYREKVDAELERQIKEGLLVPVKWNDWATPIVTCQKASGEIRIAADYRLTVNKVTPLEKYPLPKVDEMFSKLQAVRQCAAS